jgi:hypothetical protein
MRHRESTPIRENAEGLEFQLRAGDDGFDILPGLSAELAENLVVHIFEWFVFRFWGESPPRCGGW